MKKNKSKSVSNKEEEKSFHCHGAVNQKVLISGFHNNPVGKSTSKLPIGERVAFVTTCLLCVVFSFLVGLLVV